MVTGALFRGWGVPHICKLALHPRSPEQEGCRLQEALLLWARKRAVVTWIKTDTCATTLVQTQAKYRTHQADFWGGRNLTAP